MFIFKKYQETKGKKEASFQKYLLKIIELEDTHLSPLIETVFWQPQSKTEGFFKKYFD